ncbi:MAG: FAD-dependent oxidoreductase [Nanoarchaeota archaeon]|nr:FAD-dependent oxidoreductase [Nanoarchaeota archaeon]MEC8339365.1 FAD-dependent oxidoreductase [Nanoarchaeota archaeon]
MIKPIKTKAIISQIKELTPDVKHFELTLKDEMEFKAGQFINLAFEEEGTLVRKPYSIASHPHDPKKIELCIKLVPNGKLTPHLWKKEEGFEVEVMGPLGLFNLDKVKAIEETDELTSELKPQLLFIGTGTGIAPLRSMIKELIANEEDYQMTLLFGVRHEGHHCYEDEFKNLEILSPNFKYIPIVSRPTETWEGRIGHVQNNLDSIQADNTQVYICGLPLMVEETTQKLLEKGFTKEQIHAEKYV